MIDSGNPAAPAAFPPGSLLPGDVLLMLGEGPLSQLIAWCGDSIYSHAAMVLDATELVEASGAGVRRYPLAQRFADTANYHYIDAFRPLDGACGAIGEPDMALVLDHARSLLGVPYPVDLLALLGVVLAVRGKVPGDPWLRLVVREALDHVVANDPSRMVCSEAVYRCFAECAAQPAARLAPRIVLEPRGTEPFPHIDLKALWEEVWPLIRPQRQGQLQAAAPALRAFAVQDAAPPPPMAVPDDELQRGLARARAALGMEAQRVAMAAPAAAGAAGDPPVVPHPNPKLVTPLDLAATPSHRVLGRIMSR